MGSRVNERASGRERERKRREFFFRFALYALSLAYREVCKCGLSDAIVYAPFPTLAIPLCTYVKTVAYVDRDSGKANAIVRCG